MNNGTLELRLAGSGGQGVILATVILGEAAILSGRHAAQSQSYGPEARGGSCKAEVIISNKTIGYTKVRNPNGLLVLTQQAFDQYTPIVSKECLIIADETLHINNTDASENILQLPILRTAKEEVGKAMTANIVATVCINSIFQIVSKEQLQEAVLLHVPTGTEDLNIKAMNAGISMMEKYLSLGNIPEQYGHLLEGPK